MTLKDDIDQGIVLMDGALGTELEEIISKNSKIQPHRHPLWSGIVLMNESDLIKEVHKRYLDAGAKILLTSSYQLSLGGLKEFAGLNLQDAEKLWTLSVDVAANAIKEYSDGKDSNNIYILGSVGPYGAYLHNGAEYTGDYNSASEQTLIEHHVDLVETFMKDDRVEALAFETIPNYVELKAIFSILKLQFAKHGPKQFYICFTFRDANHISDGTNVKEVVTFFDENFKKDTDLYKSFIGFGVNCMDYDLVKDTLLSINDVNVNSYSLIVYPNLGFDYFNDEDGYEAYRNLDKWNKLAAEWLSQPNVKIIGGCCSTGPEEIRALSKLLSL